MIKHLIKSSLVLIGVAFSSFGLAADVYAGERISKEMILKHFVGPTWLGEFRRSGNEIKLEYEKGGKLAIYLPKFGNTLYGNWKVDDKGTVCTEYNTPWRSNVSSCRYYEYSNKPPGISVFRVSGGDMN